MKDYLRLFIFIFCTWSTVLLGKYEDQPMGLTADDIKVLASYEKRAKETLSIFDHEFPTPNNRQFYIITKLHEGDLYEQVYVKVEAKKKDSYSGKIATQPTGNVKFKAGSALKVQLEDVFDWCIVSADGEEQGNVVGKAMEALAAKTVVFIIAMKPVKGKFAQFSVISVKNPKTQQDIRAIVPEAVLSKVEQEAKKRFGDRKADDEKEKYQFILTAFPSWKLIPE